MLKKIRKMVVPAFVFQSVVIAGGYGTGAELKEFFLNYGALGGLVGMIIISMIMWSVICAASYEFARVFQTFNYRSFFKELLGKFWFLYEICYIVLLMIVLAVIASSSGEILQELFGWDFNVGVGLLMVGIVALVYFGTEAIENVLSFWSSVLYAVYILFMILVFVNYGSTIINNLQTGTFEPGWVMGSFKYGIYNLGIIPAVLFTLRDFESRSDAVISGVLSGVIGILPGIFLFLSMLGFYPEVLNAPVPTVFMLESLKMNWLNIVFQIVLFGTFIETGTGFIFAVTERVDEALVDSGKKPSKATSMALTIGLVIMGIAISQFGLLALIAKGYGTITWGFFFIYVIPVMTIGIYKVNKEMKRRKSAA